MLVTYDGLCRRVQDAELTNEKLRVYPATPHFSNAENNLENDTKRVTSRQSVHRIYIFGVRLLLTTHRSKEDPPRPETVWVKRPAAHENGRLLLSGSQE